jgi:endonuclease/exonuclease/phosphatase family metal-dependent hydrolase
MPPVQLPPRGAASRARRSASHRLAASTLLALLTLAIATPAWAIRLMSWNVLNYPGTTGSTREPSLRLAINSASPDVLVVCEMAGTSSASPTQFLNNVLNFGQPGAWTMGTFTSGPDTQNACFFRTGHFTETGHVDVITALRQIDGWTLRPAGYTAPAAELHVYMAHLKASQGSTEEQLRLAEATLLRNHLNGLSVGTRFLLGGDYNIYTDTEPAWGELTGALTNSAGQLFDPISRVGPWHNNGAFADVFTQSTRTAQLPDGGANGGMDDRFDFLLANDDVLGGQGLSYLPGSYRNYGNDGAHFNLALIDAPADSVVSAAIATALYTSSDHLPIFLDLQLPAIMVTSADLSFGGALVGASAVRALSVQNTATGPADALDYTIAAGAGFSAAPGPFVLAAGGNDLRLIAMNTATAGARLATISVAGDAPDNPSDSFNATGTVYNHAVPSTVAAAQVLGGAVDFGSHAVAAFTDQTAEVDNAGYSSLQALLDVYAAQVGGPDAARFSLVAFAAIQVGATPASFAVHFDDTGAAGGTTYTATLTFSTRDQQDLAGAALLPALTYELQAAVETGGVSAPAIVAARTVLHPNVPNPFNPATTLSFDLAHAGDATLRIYDTRGRLAATLLAGALPAGRHTHVWDGRGSDGRPLASGVYICRLQADGVSQSLRMTLVR